MEIYVVNATSCRESGALGILESFILEASLCDKQFVIFIDDSLDFDFISNIRFVKLNKRGWFRRILWDFYGIKSWLEKNSIFPKKIISLQNTTCNVKCNQIVYFHQATMFADYKFSFYKKDERILFFYKHFYSFFVNFFSDTNTKYVVQTENIKSNLVEFFGISNSNIFISFPNNMLDNFKDPVEYKPDFLCLDQKDFNLIYPSTPIFYKNHTVVLKAIDYLRCTRSDIFDCLVFNVTLKLGDSANFDSEVSSLKLDEKINYLGVVSKSNLFYLYQNSNVLTFPSFIETLGLPLVEAAHSHLPIISTAIPNSIEVLNKYVGNFSVCQNDYVEWANVIIYIYDNYDLIKSKILKNKWQLVRPGWDVLFKLLDES